MLLNQKNNENRDIMLLLILSNIMKLSHAEKNLKLVVKGGIAMRIINHSFTPNQQDNLELDAIETIKTTRFTKDIDIDSDEPVNKIKSLIRKAIKNATIDHAINATNIIITEPKMTDTTLRWKINFTNPTDNSKINLTVEVSRRGIIANDNIMLTYYTPPTYYKIPPFLITSYDKNAMAVLKIMAVLSDNRVSTRDLWDLYCLSQQQVDPIYLLSEIKQETLLKLKEELWGKLTIFSYEQFQTDLLPFLNINYQNNNLTTRNFFNNMQLTVANKIEQWLDDAIIFQNNNLLIHKNE